jgi:hypothetical protein
MYSEWRAAGSAAMKDQTIKCSLRGAIFRRVSTDQGLEQDFTLDAADLRHRVPKV